MDERKIYHVAAYVSDIGVRKHTIKAANPEEAVAKFRKAYPKNEAIGPITATLPDPLFNLRPEHFFRNARSQ